ncbi:MAG TPA: threonine/serine dehydratase [Candidatus Polarisedimenticolia bacterium]|nr:threonine/serine dehydratase [Candidatus Polarisedimenticolia bacterium]
MRHPSPWPITFESVLAAAERLRPHLRPTPVREYAPLDEAVGEGIHVFVKHENHNPTNTFKARNGLAALTALGAEERRRGVVAATRGNHGLGLAHAGLHLGVPVVICVPHGNNPEKNEAMRGFGAELVEEGRDYDEAVEVAHRLVVERGLRMVHSTDEPLVIAGAGTMTLELLLEHPDLDALVLSIGGGSQAVGALTVARRMAPRLEVYGVGAASAPCLYESWRAGSPVEGLRAETFADGLATRVAYPIAVAPLREGLTDFVKVSEREIAAAVRLYLSATHNLAEGAGAAGLAGLMRLRERLAGKRVGLVLSGGNIDAATLRKVLEGSFDWIQ